MNQPRLRLLTTLTAAMLLLFAIWYFYLHSYRVGTSTPDLLVLTGIAAAVMSFWTLFAGIKAWNRKRSPLAIAATALGTIVPLALIVFLLGALVFYFGWNL